MNERNNQFAEKFFPELLRYLQKQSDSFDQIPEARKEILAQVAQYIRLKLSQNKPAKLTFICTHNSRRSHLSQIWAHTAAMYYGLDAVETFSGGTETTAFNPRAVSAMQRSGLKIITNEPNATNPHYEVFTSEKAEPQVCFSKIYDAAPNPTTEYCAVMTCSQADDACPLVMGCDLRIPVRYEDPKVADDTDHEAAKYDERSAQICCEMLYMMSLV